MNIYSMLEKLYNNILVKLSGLNETYMRRNTWSACSRMNRCWLNIDCLTSKGIYTKIFKKCLKVMIAFSSSL